MARRRRIPNGSWKIIAVLVTIILAIASWIWNAATMSKELKTNTQDDKIVHPQVSENKERLVRIETRQEHIQLDIKEQNEMSQKILDKQDQMMELIWMASQ